MGHRTRRINVDVDEKLVRQIAATFEATWVQKNIYRMNKTPPKGAFFTSGMGKFKFVIIENAFVNPF